MLISHSHYDHLDAGSVASLNERFGGELRWYVWPTSSVYLRVSLNTFTFSLICVSQVRAPWFDGLAGEDGL